MSERVMHKLMCNHCHRFGARIMVDEYSDQDKADMELGKLVRDLVKNNSCDECGENKRGVEVLELALKMACDDANLLDNWKRDMGAGTTPAQWMEDAILVIAQRSENKSDKS